MAPSREKRRGEHLAALRAARDAPGVTSACIYLPARSRNRRNQRGGHHRAVGGRSGILRRSGAALALKWRAS